MPFDLSEYMGPFLDEAAEQISAINEGLLNLENSPGDAEAVQEIFRAAHSLKGAAGSMRFTTVADLAHGMESLLDAVRAGQKEADRPLIDLLLEGNDMLRQMIEKIAASGATQLDPGPLLSRMRAGDGASEAPPPSEAPVHPASPAGHLRVHLRLRPDPGTKGLKALLVIEKLSRLAAILSTRPPRDEVESGRFGAGFSVDLAPGADPAAIRGACAIGGVEECRVETAPSDTAPEETPKPADPAQAAMARLTAAGVAAAHVRLRLSVDARMPEARHMLVARNLAALGKIVFARPDAAAVESGKAGREAEYVVAGSADVARLKKAASVADVEEVQVSLRTAAPPAPPAVAPPRTAPQRAVVPTIRHETIRVDIRKLDHLMNLVGELVTSRSILAQLDRRMRAAVRDLKSDPSRPALPILQPLYEDFDSSFELLSRLTSSLQDSVVEVRMVPIGQVFSRFPRVVRDLSRELGKPVQLEIEGEETELDRGIIEEVGDPLVHLVRNAIDHGIETPAEREAAGKPKVAHLSLYAYQQGSRVLIEVTDDGRGIDPEKVARRAVERGLLSAAEAARADPQRLYDFIFMPGFSTAAAVSDVSGRGVGLDVVRRNVTRLSGAVEVESDLGVGTRFRLSLPLTLSIMRALLATGGPALYALPLANVEELHRFSAGAVQRVRGREVIQLHGETVELVPLPGGAAIDGRPGEHIAAIVQTEPRRGVLVDRLLGQQEVVIKPPGCFLAQGPGLAGISVLGDGSIALVLDLFAWMSGTRRGDATHE